MLYRIYILKSKNLFLAVYFVLLLSLLAYYDASLSRSLLYDAYFYAAIPLIVICFKLIMSVRNKCSLLVLLIWFVWPLFGIGYASSFNFVMSIWELKYNVAINFYQPLFIHYLATLFFSSGVRFYETFSPKSWVPVLPLYRGFPKVPWQLLLLVFPFVYLVSIYVAWKGIPILSSKAIVDDMYEVHVGIAQSFVLLIFFSTLLTTQKAFQARDRVIRWFWIGLTCLFLCISFSDGKRFVLLLSVFGIYQFIRKIGGKITKARFFALMGVSAVAYTLLAFLRAATLKAFDLNRVLGSLGVEFMEFAWTVTYFHPGQIPGYSWTQSTFASMMNGSILELLGLNKQAMVAMDSARSWSDLHNTNFGIRSGIVSELYFEFGYMSMILLTIFGILFAKLCSEMDAADSYPNYVFLLSIYSLCALAIMGQSTVTFGCITTSLYIWCAYKFVNVLSTKKA